MNEAMSSLAKVTTRRVQYIGRKPRYTDSQGRVAGTGITWGFRGDVQTVPASVIHQFNKHPEVFRDVTEQEARGETLMLPELVEDQQGVINDPARAGLEGLFLDAAVAVIQGLRALQQRDDVDMARELMGMFRPKAVQPASAEAEPAPVAEAKAKPKGREERVQAIAAAIRGLDPEAGFTKGGVARLDALEEVLGFAVTTSERDHAMQLYLEGTDAPQPE